MLKVCLIYFFLFLGNWGYSKNTVIEKSVSCYEENIRVYINIPEKRNCILFFFIPAGGYMDGSGRHNSSNPPLFEYWKTEFLKEGFSTLQFDKPGTGKSSGRLDNFTEDIMYCLFTRLDSIVPNYSHKISFVSFESGYTYLKRIWDAFSKQDKSENVVSIISLNEPVTQVFNWRDQAIIHFQLLTKAKTNNHKLLENKWAFSDLDSNKNQIFYTETGCILSKEECSNLKADLANFQERIIESHKYHFTWVENMILEEKRQDLQIKRGKQQKINLEKLY